MINTINNHLQLQLIMNNRHSYINMYKGIYYEIDPFFVFLSLKINCVKLSNSWDIPVCYSRSKIRR